MSPLKAKDARYEVKFVGREWHRPDIDAWLMEHTAGIRQAFPDRSVNNIYFDDLELERWNENITGVTPRYKLRCRWYGDDPLPRSGALELKFKRNQFGWKRAVPFRNLELDGIDWAEAVLRVRASVEDVGRNWLDASPVPVLINSYRRSYFEDQSGKVRVTVDQGLRFYDQRMTAAPNLNRESLSDDALIVEVKLHSDNHDYASKILRAVPFPASRFSKYVVGMAGSSLV